MEVIVQHIGTIEIKDGIIVADPCYDGVEVFNMGVNIGPNEISQGIYDCYVGWTKEDPCGKRVAFMEIVKDGERFKVSYNEFLGTVGVDSGTMMVGDRGAWMKNHKDVGINDEWYEANVVERCNENTYILDEGFSFLSSSGYGDGEYDTFGDSDGNDRLIRLMVEFLVPEDENEEYDILDFIDADSEPDFEAYE